MLGFILLMLSAPLVVSAETIWTELTTAGQGRLELEYLFRLSNHTNPGFDISMRYNTQSGSVGYTWAGVLQVWRGDTLEQTIPINKSSVAVDLDEGNPVPAGSGGPYAPLKFKFILTNQGPGTVWMWDNTLSHNGIIAPGDSLQYELTRRANGRWDVVETIAGETVYTLTNQTSVAYGWFENYNVRAAVAHVPPNDVRATNIVRFVGTGVTWLDEISARWGQTTTNTILPMGRITDLSLDTSLGGGLLTDLRLSTDGLVFDRIGVVTHSYVIQDDHALNTTDPQYAGDNTKAETSRTITVKTPLAPALLVKYADGVTDRDGTSIAGNIYKATASLNDCGGEDGWTNKKLDIEVNPAITPVPILGTFDTVLSIPSPAQTITKPSGTDGGVAIKKDYHTQTSSAGLIPTGVLTQQGVPGNALSAPVSGKLLVDLTNPVPGANRKPDGTFEDDSSDALSGLSGQHESLIAFVPPGGGEPTDASYTKFDELPTLVTGQYDVWVWAFDKAGNNHKAKTLTNQTINGINIGFTKDADKGAMVHVNGCPNKDEMSKESGCHDADCREGTHKEILSGEELTYELTIQNGDSSKTLTGTFTDYLPQGMIPIDTTTTTSLDGKTTNIEYTEESGRWKVTGVVTVPTGEEAKIPISCTAPAITDSSLGITKVISNQATFIWTLGSGGAGETTGSSTSNHANHRINEQPSITKEANHGAAIHTYDCANSTSLEVKDDCESSCKVANTGLVGVGDTIEYKITFDNTSNAIQYFATDATSFYDKMPDGVTLSEQKWKVSLTGPQDSFDDEGTLPTNGTSSITGTGPFSGGSSLEGLTFDVDNNGITQEGTNSLSLAPKTKLEITINAKVIEDGNDILVNQVKSGYKLNGDHDESLTTTDTDVIALNSNYTTHQRTIRGVDTKFTKVGADDLSIPLTVAKFALYKWTDTIANYAGHEGDILDVTKLNGVDDSDASIKWKRATTDGEDAITTDEFFTTDSDGEVDLGKLPDGIYTLIETQAPRGYELPVGQWIITIDNSKADTGDGNYKIEFTAKGAMLPPATVRVPGDTPSDAPTYKVVNVKPFSIGMSGMSGTRLITIIGLSLMLLTGIGYSIYRHKKSRASNKVN